MSSFCEICGVKCSGKMKVVIRKNGLDKILCSLCFDKTIMKTPTEVGKMISRRKVY